MRYTPPQSARSVWQSWLAVNPDDRRLNDQGRHLALTARLGFGAFNRLITKLADKAEEPAS